MGPFVASGGQELVTDASPSFLGQMVLKPNPEAFSRYMGIDQLVLLRGGQTLIKKTTGLYTGFPSFLFFYPLILTPSWITFPNKLSTHKPVGKTLDTGGGPGRQPQDDMWELSLTPGIRQHHIPRALPCG